MFESGLKSRDNRLFFVKKPKCHGTGNSLVSVGIIECHFIFLILVIGVILSLIIFLLEVLTAYYLKRHVDFNNKVKKFEEIE